MLNLSQSFTAMAKDLSFLPFFITEELFILPEDQPAAALASSVVAEPIIPLAASPKDASFKKPTPSIPALPTTSTKPEASNPVANPASKPVVAASTAEKKTLNQQLIFGKNLKQLLVLVEDPAHPVMERNDGLLLKDILKAVGYSFDDVAIVNIAHCREEGDWQQICEIPCQRMFSFGVSHPNLPFSTGLSPYQLETKGEKKLLLTDTLAVLRSDRAQKITLWNLLKQIFV